MISGPHAVAEPPRGCRPNVYIDSVRQSFGPVSASKSDHVHSM